MGLFDRVEAKLAATINGAFARAFKAEVQPVEIAASMRKAMDDKAAILDADRAIVPNSYVIELSASDHERLTTYIDLLTEELVASAEEHIATQHYRPAGPITISFDRLDSLETGVFRVRSSTERNPAQVRSGANDHGRGPRRPGEVIETHRSGDDPAWRIPRNPAYPPEATAAAEGEISMASHAASAAAGAAAGTAAAARDLWERARNDQPDLTDAERAQQRRNDLSAWKESAEAPQSPHEPGTAARGRDEIVDSAAYAAVPSAPEIPPHLRPDPANRPWIDVAGDAYPLLGAITVIGRDPGAEITLDDGGISRRHCEIRVTHDGPHLVIGLRDLGSTNGTFVNGERVNTARLDNGDRITIGRVSFVLHTRRR